MKVKELINALTSMDQNIEVCHGMDGMSEYVSEIDGVSVRTDTEGNSIAVINISKHSNSRELGATTMDTTAQLAPTDDKDVYVVVMYTDMGDGRRFEIRSEEAYLATSPQDAVNQYVVTQGQGQEDVPEAYYDSTADYNEVQIGEHCVFGPYPQYLEEQE